MKLFKSVGPDYKNVIPESFPTNDWGIKFYQIYHPWNSNSFNMDQILHTTQLEKDLLKIEKKITKYNYHKEFLENYKYNRKYPKGLTLKFNLALCEDSEHVQKSCRNILRNASFKLRDHILKIRRFKNDQKWIS